MSDAEITPDPAIPELVPLAAAARILGCTRAYVRRRLAREGIDPGTVGKRLVVVPRAEVEAVADGRHQSGADPLALDSPSTAAQQLDVDFHHVDRLCRAGVIPCSLVTDARGRENVAIRPAVSAALAALMSGREPGEFDSEITEHHHQLRTAARRLTRHVRAPH